MLKWGNIPSLFLLPDLKCCITCLNIWLLKCSLVVSELFSGDVINRRCPECTAVSFSQFLWTSKFFEHSHIRPLVLFVSGERILTYYSQLKQGYNRHGTWSKWTKEIVLTGKRKGTSLVRSHHAVALPLVTYFECSLRDFLLILQFYSLYW